jgi:hypothetical protein
MLVTTSINRRIPQLLGSFPKFAYVGDATGLKVVMRPVVKATYK